MAFVAAYEDVKSGREERPMKTPGARGWRTRFIQPPQGAVDHPVAFLVEGTKERVIRPHYHEVDQFQVIVKGGGALGRHPLSMYAVHFTRAHTPYGPILFAEEGLGFLTLRAHWDPGAQYIPDKKEVLSQIPNRRPWQATEAPRFQSASAVDLQAFDHIRDDRGLAAYAITMQPNATTAAPEVSKTNGQYIIVTNGSIVHEGQTKASLTIIFVKPDEPAFTLQAGPEGMEALILNFPQTTLPARAMTAKTDSPRHRLWQCDLCAFAYDESKGMPDDGIAPGTRWEDVPADWICPDCGTTKADFQMREVE
jgi:rubredoxin